MILYLLNSLFASSQARDRIPARQDWRRNWDCIAGRRAAKKAARQRRRLQRRR